MDWIFELEKLLEKDVRNVIAKGDISPTDYTCLDTAIDIFKDCETIRAMMEGGYNTDDMPVSRNSYGPGMNSYGMNSYGMNGNGGNSSYMPWSHSYDQGNSYARGRSSVTGQYVSRDNEMTAKLQHMMNTAQTEQERDVIARLMNEMGR